MAENFRSKKWFNELSPERKAEICKKFEITEDVLKHAGRLNKDGNVVIDLLRVSYDFDKRLNKYADIVKTEPAQKALDVLQNLNTDYEDAYNALGVLYTAYTGKGVKNYSKKYINKIMHRHLYIKMAIDMFRMQDDPETIATFSKTLLDHARVFIESECESNK